MVMSLSNHEYVDLSREINDLWEVRGRMSAELGREVQRAERYRKALEVVGFRLGEVTRNPQDTAAARRHVLVALRAVAKAADDR